MPEVRTARVTVIPAKKDRLPIAALGVEEKKRLRVAAYARVSTNNEEHDFPARMSLPADLIITVSMSASPLNRSKKRQMP